MFLHYPVLISRMSQNFSQQNNLTLQKRVSGVHKVVNFKDFSIPNKEVKYFLRT